jgi:hypothetical protein
MSSNSAYKLFLVSSMFQVRIMLKIICIYLTFKISPCNLTGTPMESTGQHFSIVAGLCHVTVKYFDHLPLTSARKLCFG